MPLTAVSAERTPTLPYAVPRIAAGDPPSFDRFGLHCGVAAAVLYAVGAVLFLTLIVPDLPPFRAPAPERAAYYAEMSRSTLYRSLSYLGQSQLLLLPPFFAALLGVLRRAEGGSGSLSFAVFGAGIALAIVPAFAMLVEDHLLLGLAVAGGDPVIVASYDGLVPKAFALGGFPQVLAVGGAAAILRRRGLASRALGWSGYAVAVISLLGTGTLMRGGMFPISSLSTLLTRLWLLALAIVLLRRAGREG